MQTITFDTTEPIDALFKENLKTVVRKVFGAEEVQFMRVPNADLTFGITLPSVEAVSAGSDWALTALETALRKLLPPKPLSPWGAVVDDAKVLYFDIETHDADLRWNMPLPEFFRLGQFGFGSTGDVVVTSRLAELQEATDQAEALVAHNGHQFDFSVMLGDDALEWALGNRLFDTMVFANLNFPAPVLFTMRSGAKVITTGKPEAISRWLSLDNLAFKLDVPGKEGDLKALAKEFGGFGNIPVDEPRYVAYAEQDVHMLRHITNELLLRHKPTAYDWREQQKAAIDAQMSRNGLRVNPDAARQRVADLAERKAELMVDLVENHGLPSEGKMPWRTNKGKAAVLSALAKSGLDPLHTSGWPQLKTGPSLSGPVILEFTKGTEAEEFGIALAELQGQRSLAEQALTYTQADGRVHPSISGWQKSGRRSITQPGLTTWGERNPIDKRYFLASEGCKLIEFDLSNADQRIVAALSQDKAYAKRFLPGVDGHEISGRLMFGDATYETNPHLYRPIAKALSHAYSFGAAAKTLARTAKQPLEIAQQFIDAMRRAYPGMIAWQNKVRTEGERGYVINRWGRKMQIDKERAYTQAPAAHGQSGTTEVLYDGLLKMARKDVRLVRWLVCLIHDAILMDVPEGELDYVCKTVPECMAQNINGIDFPISHGPAADTWEGARH